MRSKKEMHHDFCSQVHDVYIAKNADYGDSFARIRDKYREQFPVILIRLEDKLNRLNTLMLQESTSQVAESIEDTLLDLAGYCILELTERADEKEKSTLGAVPMPKL